MANQTFTTRQAAEIEASKMNAARPRTNIEYVASETLVYQAGKMVCTGYHIGVCSDD